MQNDAPFGDYAHNHYPAGKEIWLNFSSMYNLTLIRKTLGFLFASLALIVVILSFFSPLNFLVMLLPLTTSAVFFLANYVRSEVEKSVELQEADPIVNPDPTVASLLPELRNLEKHLNSLESRLTKNPDSDEQVQALNAIATERGDELRQYKEGFIFARTRQMILGIIASLDSIRLYEQELARIGDSASERDRKYLQAIAQRLQDVLADQDIEEFSPDLRSKASSDRALIKTVRAEETQDKNQVGTIAQVVHPGYRLYITSDESRIVRPAQVIVYSNPSGGNSDE